ncbi:MAG: DUF1707 domain-containing protein, partial [Candidatus Nanopelagicales bacterium]
MPANEDPQLRAGDADRDDVIIVLREAFAEGRLDQAEFEDRLGRAQIAKTYADLTALTVDLPPNNEAVPERSTLRLNTG